MTKKTYKQKDGSEWSWEQSKELTKLLKELHQTKKEEKTK